MASQSLHASDKILRVQKLGFGSTIRSAQGRFLRYGLVACVVVILSAGMCASQPLGSDFDLQVIGGWIVSLERKYVVRDLPKDDCIVAADPPQANRTSSEAQLGRGHPWFVCAGADLGQLQLPLCSQKEAFRNSWFKTPNRATADM
ncbi:unnamed protein product [Symbiodinium sp. CCMP2456]|nr:unnamed protein product [Symbiodinium sp. CCMP2456]